MKIEARITVRGEWFVDIDTSCFGGFLTLKEAKELFHALGSALRDVKASEVMFDGLE